jgi:hypothetical protein
VLVSTCWRQNMKLWGLFSCLLNNFTTTTYLEIHIFQLVQVFFCPICDFLFYLYKICLLATYFSEEGTYTPYAPLLSLSNIPEALNQVDLGSPPCSFGLSATRQQYFSLKTNQPLATSQQYFSLRTNQHQTSATSRRLHAQPI